MPRNSDHLQVMRTKSRRLVQNGVHLRYPIKASAHANATLLHFLIPRLGYVVSVSEAKTKAV